MFKKILALCLCVFVISSALLVTGVSAYDAEMSIFYDPCHSLDNIWAGSNIQLVDDVIGDANYNNGGKMIGLADNGAFEIVYKVPDGRSLSSFFTEMSTQDISASGVKLAYSEDGDEYTDFTFTWNQGSRPSTINGNNAYWSWKYSVTVTAPENADVKFIKIYHNGDGINRTYKFYLRKVSMFTAGGSVSGDATDSLSGAEGLNYEISNLMSYDLYCYNKGTTEASELATETDLFSDADMLAVSDLTKDAYVIYKAADTAAFASIEVNEAIRDQGKSMKIYASADGYDYTEITPNSSRKGFVNSSTSEGAPGACWNSHYVLKSDFGGNTTYKYIKLMHPANTLTNANHYKLGSVSFTTLDMSKGCITGDVFEEEFDSDMYHISEFKNAEADGSSLSISKDGYVIYKTLPGRELKEIELVTENAVFEALDINKNKILWNTEITTDGNTISSTVPDGAAYLKLSGASVYTGITIKTDNAVGSEWTYIDGEPGFSAELAGEPIDKLKSGCTVSFSIPVKNAGSELQSAKAYICVFEGDRMDKIEVFGTDVKAGGKATISGSTEVSTVTEKTSVTVFLWTDLDSMTALGTEQIFKNK